MNIKTQLLCTFCKKPDVQGVVDKILATYTILFDKIFVLQEPQNSKELMCTYNIDVTNGFPADVLENTISLHRKKETNTLYTINALNMVVMLLNGGKLDKSFPIPWENYRNTLLLTNDSGLKQVQTEICEVIKIVVDN